MRKPSVSQGDAARCLSMGADAEPSFETLLAYVDDELPPQARAQIERLRVLSPRVRRDLEALEEVCSELIAPLPSLRTVDLTEGVLTAIARADEEGATACERSWWTFLTFGISSAMFSSGQGEAGLWSSLTTDFLANCGSKLQTC
jgi:anti-sigma factor RsiW